MARTQKFKYIWIIVLIKFALFAIISEMRNFILSSGDGYLGSNERNVGSNINSLIQRNLLYAWRKVVKIHKTDTEAISMFILMRLSKEFLIYVVRFFIHELFIGIHIFN